MPDQDRTSKSSTGLAVISIVLLIVGMAPVGLFQLARSIGLNTASSSTVSVATIFGLLVVCSLVYIGFKVSARLAFLILLGLALLNLAGCSVMWSDFSRISLHDTEIKLENKTLHTITDTLERANFMMISTTTQNLKYTDCQ